MHPLVVGSTRRNLKDKRSSTLDARLSDSPHQRESPGLARGRQKVSSRRILGPARPSDVSVVSHAGTLMSSGCITQALESSRPLEE